MSTKLDNLFIKYGRLLTADQQKELYDILHHTHDCDRVRKMKWYLKEKVGISFEPSEED